jgi:GAF domain-containing protein
MYEDKRLESIKKLKILDTIPEEIYDDIVKRVKEKFDVPIALLSIVDLDRQWFKSCIGVDVTETPRSVSFCSRAIQEDKPLVIPNATLDPRFMDNELVTGEFGLRFYAGVPIKTPDNYVLGTICILDKKPREFLKNDEEELINFAKLIELELVERQKK